MKDISVILINYNSSSFTINCIESIIEHTSSSLSYEFVVVDNASHWDDYTALRNKIKELNLSNLQLIRSKYNTGFGGGNMHGIQFANGKYYAFVNNDTLLQNDCLNIETIGGFDTNIFLYYEETDLCYRIAKNNSNGRCFLVPEGRYTHFKGQSTGKSLAIKKELKISLLYVLRKNSGYLAYQTLRCWLTFKFFFKSIIKPKNFVLFKLFLKGAPLSDSLKLKQTIAKK